MTKLLSCLLSFVLIFTSVAPSFAQAARGGKAARGLVRAVTGTPRVPKSAKGISGAVGKSVERRVLQRTNPSLKLTHSAWLSTNSAVSKAEQILNYKDPAKRAILLQADFPVFVLERQASPRHIEQAVSFYRSQLSSPEKLFTNVSLQGNTSGAVSLAGTVGNLSSLGLMGTAATDAPLIENVFLASVGTEAEPVITAAAARALLRLGAYEELARMSAVSTQQPELWAGISEYAQAYQLPLTIASANRKTVDVSSFQSTLYELGDVNVRVVSPKTTSTFYYMDLGKESASGAADPLRSAISSLPGAEVVDLAAPRDLYASTGDGFAHTGKVQPEMPQATIPATQAVPQVPTDATTPRWVETEAVNQLGTPVQTWQPNPEHPQYNPLTQASSSSQAKSLSWLDKARLNWAINFKPAFQNLFGFASTPYGLASLGAGAAPITSEAVIAQADTPAIVQTVRAQQGTFVSDEALRSGSGVSYRTGTVNPGGLAAQQYAYTAPAEAVSQPAASGTHAALTPSKAYWAQAYEDFFGVPAPEVLPARAYVNPNTRSSAAAPLYGLIFPLSRRFANFITDSANATSKDVENANKIAESVLSKPQPLASQIRDIIVGNASIALKQKALLRLYEQGVFSKFLNKQVSSVKNKIIQASSDQERAEALFRLYQVGYLDPILQGLTPIQEQGTVLTELQNIVSQDDWSELARSAYETESVLPLESENFMGAVSVVPEPDLEKIEDLVRPAGYAVANSSQGVVTRKGIYYENNIPFYYRNSTGAVSSQPVGVLTQLPSDAYGRFLSAMHLANRPGFTVPEGFVLALDEQGQWKFVVPKGNLSIVEASRSSRKKLNKMGKDGSLRVFLDTNYSTSDLLAMAHLLEHNPERNLELSLNTPHSLKSFLFLHALFVGNDAGNTLTGPFKDTAKKTWEAVAGFVTNLLSGIGYATPIAGGYAMPTMKKWGNVKTTQVIYGASAAALAGSLVMGMNGLGSEAPALPLLALAVPTVALVLGASLINSFVPYFLNFYKDPAARTAANLEFDTRKQMSRMGLSALTAGTIALGGNWTVVVPVGLALLGLSYAMFRNTPMYKGEQARKALEAEAKKKEAERFASLTPQQQEMERAAQAKAAEEEKELQARFVAEYEAFRDNHAEMKASKGRVKKVYAAYAASLMILAQSAAEAYGKGTGQLFVTLCMAATLGTRLLSTYLVKNNKVTDDQLTGLSLPTMALTAIALGLLPYSGVAAGVAGAAAILHYMSTAVPGRLDAARMQNIVTAEMQQRKQQVLDNPDLTPDEKKAQVDLLTREESTWASRASRDYSFYNSHGLIGIGVAALAALGLSDLGPQYIQDALTQAFSWTGKNSVSLALNRLLFLYAGGVAGWAYLTNRDLTREGLRLFRGKTAVTAQNIQENKVTPKILGINDKNAEIQLGNITSKRMKEVEPLLVEYGISSEQKMTGILQKLQFIHNRLVAISQILGPDATRAAFEREASMARRYLTIMGQNDLSVMLRRESEKLKQGIFEPGTLQLRETPGYIEEGLYELPAYYTSYEAARMQLKEIDQMAFNLRNGNQIDYAKFAEYLTRIRANLLQYENANPADSIRVMTARRTLNNVCLLLAQEDKTRGLLNVLDTDSQQVKQGKQALRDLLSGYEEEFRANH